MKNKLPKIIFAAAFIAFAIYLLVVWNNIQNVKCGNDEYFFYRATLNLPNYATSGQVLTESPSNALVFENYDAYVNGPAYNTPVWVHPLVDNYLAYPVAKIFQATGENIQSLRLFCVALMLATVFFLADIVRRKTNYYIAALSIVPLFVGQILLANGIMFYNDLYQWLFFALTLWLIEKNPHSKWIYLFAALVVLSKFYSVLLIIPIWLQLRSKNASQKNKVAAVGIICAAVFFIMQGILAQDILFQWHHWMALRGTSFGNITETVIPNYTYYLFSWGLWLFLPLVLWGIYSVVRNKKKAYYGFAAFGLLVLAFSAGWGFYPYHVQPIMYVSMLAIPAIWFANKNLEL